MFNTSLSLTHHLRIAVSLLLISLSWGVFAQESFQFKQFYLGDGLPSGQVYQVIQDQNKYLWFATDRGVCLYNGQSFKTFNRKHGLSDEVVFGFHLQKNGRLWFYTYKGGICYYENDSIQSPSFNTSLIKEIEQQKTIIVSLFVAPDGNTWVGLKNSAVLKISPVGEISKPFENDQHLLRPKLVSLSKHAFAFSAANRFRNDSTFLYIENDNTISVEVDPYYWDDVIACWVGDDSYIVGIGFHLYRIRKGRIEARYKLPHKVLYALHLDQHQQLWVGTRNGIFKFDDLSFTKQPKHYLSGYEISSSTQDHEGGYWFTSIENGIFYLPGLEISAHYNNDNPKAKFHRIEANDNGLVAIRKNHSAVFIKAGETMERTPYYLPSIGAHGATYRLSYLIRVDSIKTSLSEAQTFMEKRFASYRRFHFKRNDDRSPYAWVASEGMLSFCLYSSDSIFLSIPHEEFNTLSVAANEALNEFWVGTSRGLYQYTKGSLKKVMQFSQLLDCRIIDLDLISDSILLITTRGDGVLKYNPKKKMLERIEGITHDYCNESYVDHKGTVWVATYSGIYRVDAIESAHPICRLITEQHGLASNEIHDIVGFKDQIWVAASNAICHWHMDWVPKYLKSPAEVTGIMVNNQAAQKLKNLDYRENNIHFAFECIRFREPVEFLYRLKGMHKNWIGTKDPMASYSALNPGKYTFELKAKNQQASYLSIPIYISPPFWLSPWFYALGILVAMASLFLFIRIRFRIISKQNKLYALFVKAEEKALLAQVNPHFLFNSFNSILELLATKRNALAQTYIYAFAKLMRTVLQSAREPRPNLSRELMLMQQYIELEALRIDWQIDFRLNVPEQLNTQRIIVPPLLLQPYVENALKHGIKKRQDGKAFIQIDVSVKNLEELHISIADNGLGYDKTPRKKGKYKSYGMQINQDRLKLFAKRKRFKISIEKLNPVDTAYPGTLISLTLPYLTTENETIE